MTTFTVIDVKTEPNIERIRKFAEKNGLCLREAVEKKQIGDGYFPIRDQKIVSIGIFTWHTKNDKGMAKGIVFAGEEKKIINEVAKHMQSIRKITNTKPYFVTGDGRKYALEILAGRMVSYMVEAKEKGEEIIPEVAEMLKLLTDTKSGYLKTFDTKDSIDLQNVLGLGIDKIPLPSRYTYKNEDLEPLIEETANAVIDMMKNYAAYAEIHGEEINPKLYQIEPKNFKKMVFPLPEEREGNEVTVNIDEIEQLR